MIFQVPGVSLGGQKWVQNGIRIASSTRKASESLLGASWSALGGSWSRKNSWGAALGRPRGASRRDFSTQEVLDLGSTGNGKRIVLKSKDQANIVHHAGGSIEYRFDLIAILCHPVQAPK